MHTIPKKGLYIKTYGCQMNVYDSAKMAELLKPHGFDLVDSEQYADMVILNTCHIREKASEKIYSELGRLAHIKNRKKKNGDDMLIVVAGCTAQAEGEEIFKRSPIVDIIVGPRSYNELPFLIEEVKRTKKWVINLEFDERAKFDYINQHILDNLDNFDNQVNKLGAFSDNLTITNTSEIKVQKDSKPETAITAFLSIQEGCDKFCHFCVVPFTRGVEYSRTLSEIYREALILVSKGVKEITLLGQNVNAYHGRGLQDEPCGLGKLVKSLAKIDGLERIRYTTSHPIDMNDEDLFDAHENEKKLMPFIHLPVQSGSDKILKKMNRKHTSKFYIEIIEKFRKINPKIAFSSDFIVGYPGEDESDFDLTMELVKEIGYADAYSFKYSPRPGTTASILPNQITEDVKTERLYRLQELLKKQQLQYNESKIGKEVEVLIERVEKQKQITGKSQHMQTVVLNYNDALLKMNNNIFNEQNTISDDVILGKVLNVRVNIARQRSLICEIL